MADLTRRFSLADQPEIFASSAETSRTVGAAVKAGRARKIGPPPLHPEHRRAAGASSSTQLAAGCRTLLSRAPSSSTAAPSRQCPPRTDRFSSMPARATRPAARLRLPGLILRPRRGPGAVPGDMPFMDGHPLLRSRPEVPRQHATVPGRQRRHRAYPLASRDRGRAGPARLSARRRRARRAPRQGPGSRGAARRRRGDGRRSTS